MEKVIEDKCSAGFKINTRGQWSGEVKVYAVLPEAAYERALELAERMEEQIREKNEPKS